MRFMYEDRDHNSGSSRSAAEGAHRVLLVSYEFPATGGSGVQRAAKLAKYLPRCGWEVDVLTAGHSRFPWHDPSLLRDVPASCRVHRIAGREPACVAAGLTAPLSAVRPLRRWVEDRIYWRLARRTARRGLGNGESLWVPAAVAAALRLCREHRFDAMISTGPPHFVHRVAQQVARKAGLPWVADLRDPLVSDFERSAAPCTSAGEQDELRRLERDILTGASEIVTTAPSFSAELRERYPQARIRTITNGFDPDDLAGLPVYRSGTECVFVAAGSFYGRREISRLTDPLARVLQQQPEWRGKVRLVLAGSIDAAQEGLLHAANIDCLCFEGYLDHRSALSLAATAACNIVIVPDCAHGRRSIPGKTFELLALPVHILGLVPGGSDTERVLWHAGAATTVAFEDAGRVAGAMHRIIADHFAGRLQHTRVTAGTATYDRRIIARQFCDCLDSACGLASILKVLLEPASSAPIPSHAARPASASIPPVEAAS